MTGKKFFFSVCSGIVCFFLISAAVRIFKFSYWQPNKESTMSIYLYQRTVEKPDVVFLGSSTCYTGIFPAVIEEVFRLNSERISTFNIGQDGAIVRTYSPIVAHVLQHGQKPKMLILAIDTWAFNSNSPMSDAYYKYYASQFEIFSSLIEGNRPPYRDAKLEGFFRDISNLLLLPWKNPRMSGYREQLASYKKHKGVVPLASEKNLFTMTASERDDYRKYYIAYLQNDLLSNFTIEGSADKAFKDILLTCRNRGIRLVIINMPVHPDLLEGYSKGENQQVVSYLRRNCAASKIPFFDLQGQIELLDEDFRDLIHVNENGAIKISRYVAERIIHPLLEGAGEEELE